MAAWRVLLLEGFCLFFEIGGLQRGGAGRGVGVVVGHDDVTLDLLGDVQSKAPLVGDGFVFCR